jgi:Outer membrane protein beta-barrel domain
MQSVRLKKSLTFPRSAHLSISCRQNPYLLTAFLLVLGLLPCAIPVHAQDTQTAQTVPETKEKFDVGVGGFYQITNASNGNFIREDTTSSGGGLVSFRQPYRPWLGYEANVGFTKFYEAYNKGVVKVQSNVTDVTFAYLLQSPTYYGFQPFLTLGGGVIVFSPIAGTITSSNTTPTKLPSQLLPEFTYGVGLNYPIFSRFGLRGQLRGLKYKTPDFHQDTLNTHTLRSTLEPTLSVYYRF